MMYNGGPNQPELSVGSIREFMPPGVVVLGIVLDNTDEDYYSVVSIHGRYLMIPKSAPYKQVRLPSGERVRVNKVRDLVLQKAKIDQEISALKEKENQIDIELGKLGF